ncbi:hypothetical protein VTK56DRAFT_9040 [Thermocarpiscus australiensis]
MRGRVLLACMCRYCRYHFVFIIQPGGQEANTAHLQHHLHETDAEWYDYQDAESAPSSKLFPMMGRVRYSCTLCDMNITLDITFPRLKPEWILLITDENRIRESLRIAKEEDAERYKGVTEEKEKYYVTSPLHTLNQYLKNIVDDDGTGSRKRISCRNKTFLVQFGRACDHIFRYLGFQEEYDETTRDSFWVPPRLTPQEGKTPLGSPRAFYENVRSEVQSLLDERPPVDGQPVVTPISARDQLEWALGCEKFPRRVSAVPADDSEAQHFKILGATADADDSMLKFAYHRQVETDPEHASVYLEALGSLSARRSMDLQLFVVSQQEVLATMQRANTAAASGASPVDKAYAHFGLTRNCPEPPSYFINVYRTYREQSPAQKSEHRLALLQIGRDRDSKEILDEVYGTKMDLMEACQYLSVEPDWPMDSIAVMAQSVAADSDLDLLLMALDTISLSRPVDDLNRADFENVLTELRSSRQLQLISEGADQQTGTSTVGRMDGSEDTRETVNMDLPVGLANLRNTCYLNSILQYFYSVNAVRDLALNSDLPPLEPTELNMSRLLRSDSSNQSQPDLETGRAFVGHEFTRELSTLFREIDACAESSITPRQRLANAALLRPEKLRPRSADAIAPSQGNGDAPPLPPRAGESSSPKATNTPVVETEQIDTASADSSQTLVDQGDTGVETSAANGVAAAVASPTDKEQLPSAAAAEAASEGARTSKLTVEELAAELDKPNVGSDQMDVDEVMGNAIDHLRAAFKMAQIGRSDAVPDPIEQAFFSTFIDNRKRIGNSEWTRTTRSDRWVTAYPAQSGTLDLYDALSNSFDLEPLPGDLLSFTTIQRPAPHFHVCIQRSDGVRKNTNPITIPETLYLDRFMHTDDNESPLFKSRKRRWDIKTRLNEITLTAANEQRPAAAKEEPQVPGRSSESSTRDNLADEEVDGFLMIGSSDVPSLTDTANSGPDEDDLALQSILKRASTGDEVMGAGHRQTGTEKSPSTTGETTYLPPADLDEFWQKFDAEENAERDRLIEERDRIFSDCHEVAYRLHAVVCHAGATAAAGHYWVWIHDFERDVWRKYNDTTVSVHPAEFVFGELNTKGEPYYLAYVRAEDVQNLVSIPPRRRRTPPPVPPRHQPTKDEDTVMSDEGTIPIVLEHLEDVDMPPPAYAA